MMLHSVLHAALVLAAPLLQESVIAPPPRVSADVVKAAGRGEGRGGPVVRIPALTEPGKTPQVPGPLLRAPAGTIVRLTLRNRSDSALMFGGFRQSLPAADDTVHVAAGA